jgi:tetratricopeptide (TPR) repeat protein
MRIAFLMVAAGIAGAAPLRAQSVAEHVSAGVAARAARDPAAAVAHFQAALAQDSMSYEANWGAALALIDVGKATPDSVRSPERDSLYALAEVYARRAVAANPADAEGHFALANAVGRASLTKSKKERIRRAAEIRSEALRAIELNPRHDGAYHVMGRWNAEIMRLSGMTRFLARSFLGAGIFRQASWEGAVTNMEKAVELDPRRIYHRLDLAEVYVDRHRFADARSQLQQIEALPVSDVLDPVYKAQAAALLRQIADRKDS